jgi:hypothetical protein
MFVRSDRYCARRRQVCRACATARRSGPGVLLLAGFEELLAVVAAEREGEAVPVDAELLQAVGGVARVCPERVGEAGGVAGEPAGKEIAGARGRRAWAGLDLVGPRVSYSSVL